MAMLVWTVLCSKSSIDSRSNNISLFEVVEQLAVDAPPDPGDRRVVLPLAMELVSLWTRSDAALPETASGRVRHLGADGAELTTLDVTVDLATHRRVRMVIQIGGLAVPPVSGTHILEMSVREADGTYRVVSNTPIEVNINQVAVTPQ